MKRIVRFIMAVIFFIPLGFSVLVDWTVEDNFVWSESPVLQELIKWLTFR